MSSILSYVQAAAAKGWHVLPLHRLTGTGACTCQLGADCKSAAKHPLHRGWESAPDLTAEEIERTWGGQIAPNYGIRTGNGLLVIDEDPDKGGDIMDLAADLEEEFLDTFTVRTGSGGRHFYLQLPDGVVLGNSAGKLGVGIDTRGDGGFVVGPGSTSSKGGYAVVLAGDILPAPAELLERLVTRARPDKATTAVPMDPSKVSPAHQAYVRRGVERELERLDAMRTAAVGGGWENVYRGEPWDAATYAVACNLVELANTGAGYTLEQLHGLFLQHAPLDKDFVRGNHEDKWAGALQKVGANCRDLSRVGTTNVYGGDIPDAFGSPPEGTRTAPAPTPEAARDAADRFAVRVGDRDDAAMYDETIQAMLAYDAADPRLFRSGGEMVRLDLTSWRLVPLSVPGMRLEAARRAAFYQMKPVKGEEEKVALPSSAPKQLLEMLLDNVDARFPECSAVSETGFFTPEGQWWDQRGYCPEAGAYCTGTVTSDAIPDRPSRVDAELAAQRLLEPLAGFPFADQPSRAHALAMMLLPFMRSMVDGITPMHLIQAGAPGTGKTMLAETLLHPACGDVALNDAPGRKEEMVKTVFSALRVNPRALVLDNIPEDSMFGAGELASMLTAYPVHSARVLGTSTQATVSTVNVWCATGNNPSFTEEIARRLLIIDLDVKGDPLERTFEIKDLRAWMRQHRGAMIAAAATVIRAWVVAGRPGHVGPTMSSYETYVAVMGGVLQHAGVHGFLTNQRELRKRGDAQTTAMLDFLGTWAQMKGANGELEARQTTGALLAMMDEADIDIPGVHGATETGRRISLGKWIKRALVGKTLPGGYSVEAIRFGGGVANGFLLSQRDNVQPLRSEAG